MSAARVSISPRLITNKNNGTMPPLKYMVRTIILEMIPRPGNLPADKTYAVQTVRNKFQAVPKITTIKVFLKPDTKLLFKIRFGRNPE